MNISHKNSENDKIVIKINNNDNIVIKRKQTDTCHKKRYEKINRYLLQKEIWKNKTDICYEKKVSVQEEDMLDIKFVRENPEIVKQNIRNKFQDSKTGAG